MHRRDNWYDDDVKDTDYEYDDELEWNREDTWILVAAGILFLAGLGVGLLIGSLGLL